MPEVRKRNRAVKEIHYFITKDKTLLSVIKDGCKESTMLDWIDKLESVTEPQKKRLTSSRRIIWPPYSYDKEHSCPLRSNERHLGIKQQPSLKLQRKGVVRGPILDIY